MNWKISRAGALFVVGGLLFVTTIPNVCAAETPRTFATTDEAVAALTAGVDVQDKAELESIFGPSLAGITSPDEVQAKNDFEHFAAALKAGHRITLESNDRAVLEVGVAFEPFPVPLLKEGGRWHFNTAAGIEEIINRRIGRNELAAIRSMRAYVDAQREYARRDRDGDDVLEYAQKLISSPGQTDGLYWPLELDHEQSPLGPYLAFAQDDGYLKTEIDPDAEPEPFYGYYFKILTKQGSKPPGGKYDYVINENMIGGFALVSWPAVYGETGIMTFGINQQGRVYQKDLGPQTEQAAGKIKEFNPDDTWSVSSD